MSYIWSTVWSFRYIRGARLQLRSQRTLRSLRTVMVRTRSGFGIMRLQCLFRRTFDPYSYIHISFWSFYFNHIFLKTASVVLFLHPYSLLFFLLKPHLRKKLFLSTVVLFLHPYSLLIFLLQPHFLKNCFCILSYHSFIHIPFLIFLLKPHLLKKCFCLL